LSTGVDAKNRRISSALSAFPLLYATHSLGSVFSAATVALSTGSTDISCLPAMMLVLK
jgi:hypothetical protein